MAKVTCDSPMRVIVNGQPTREITYCGRPPHSTTTPHRSIESMEAERQRERDRYARRKAVPTEPIPNGTHAEYIGSIPFYYGEVEIVASEPDDVPDCSRDGFRYTVKITGKDASKHRAPWHGECLRRVRSQSLRIINGRI